LHNSKEYHCDRTRLINQISFQQLKDYCSNNDHLSKIAEELKKFSLLTTMDKISCQWIGKDIEYASFLFLTSIY